MSLVRFPRICDMVASSTNQITPPLSDIEHALEDIEDGLLQLRPMLRLISPTAKRFSSMQVVRHSYSK